MYYKNISKYVITKWSKDFKSEQEDFVIFISENERMGIHNFLS